MSGKGSTRRPGDIPADRWDAIFGKKPEPFPLKREPPIEPGQPAPFDGIDIDKAHQGR